MCSSNNVTNTISLLVTDIHSPRRHASSDNHLETLSRQLSNELHTLYKTPQYAGVSSYSKQQIKQAVRTWVIDYRCGRSLMRDLSSIGSVTIPKFLQDQVNRDLNLAKEFLAFNTQETNATISNPLKPKTITDKVLYWMYMLGQSLTPKTTTLETLNVAKTAICITATSTAGLGVGPSTIACTATMVQSKSTSLGFKEMKFPIGEEVCNGDECNIKLMAEKLIDVEIVTYFARGALQQGLSRLRPGMILAQNTISLAISAAIRTEDNWKLYHELVGLKIDLRNCDPSHLKLFLNKLGTDRKSIIKILFNRCNLNIDKIDAEGRTLLTIAVRAQDDLLLAVCLDNGANPNIGQCHSPEMYSDAPPRMTALQCAAQLDDEKILRLLIEYGADINSTDFSGTTALNEMIKRFYFRRAERFININVNVTIPDLYGNTAAHWAAMRLPQAWSVLERIYAFGGDPHAMNMKGETPSELAKSQWKKIGLVEEAAKTTPEADPWFSPMWVFPSLALGLSLLYNVFQRKEAQQLRATANALKTKGPISVLVKKGLTEQPETSKLPSVLAYKRLIEKCEELGISTDEFSVPEEFECPINRIIMDDPVIIHGGHTLNLDAFKEWEATSLELWSQHKMGEYMLNSPCSNVPFPDLSVVNNETNNKKRIAQFPTVNRNLILRTQIEKWCAEKLPRLKEKIAAVTIQRAYRQHKALKEDRS